MTHVLIVGKKFTALTDYLTKHEYSFTLLQDMLATKYPEKHFKNRLVADFSSRSRLLVSLDKLKHTPDMVVATYENYVLPAAWIADHLNLPGLPIPAAEACMDKFLMRTLFAQASEKISPDFAIVESEDDVRSFADAHDFPLILKPANLAKSLLVTKNSSLEELVANYHKSFNLLSSTYKKYAPNRAPKLIIEEFLEGSIHSVDAFVDFDGIPRVLEQVVDYQTGYDIGYDDNFHFSRLLPSSLSADDQTALRHCAEVGIQALGIKNSPAHVEIIMTHDGPRIVEIGARNGGYRERMHRLANGIDITGAALQTASGKIPEITAAYNKSCAVLEIFPKTQGKFVRVDHLSELEHLPSLHYLSIKAKSDAVIGKAADGYKAVAIVILAHHDSNQLQRDLEYITLQCQVVTNS